MLAYRVDDMTCSHCASAITKAVRKVVAGAKVDVDLVQHLVRIEAANADAAALTEAIIDAGYTPVPALKHAPAPTASTGGCCCSTAGSRCGA
jgi:copper chaperone